ncbi:hypothetical protein B0H66DRAFT_487607 [Apodospora peruviana]|uniref:3-hydroxyacyl-CoA dehydrogenase n=1 Tax=Apodospora peruviana TaxID=516989 RepID=A0AAE0IUL3_9PEZI|nr:hypothetical protein B0H66DRAFT_487607 [Apodospora peruviana]
MTWTPPTIGSRHVVVLGGGVLGRRIACTFVSAGYNTHIRDPFPSARSAAIQYIDENKLEYAKSTRLGPHATPDQLGQYAAFEDIESACKDAWLVIEAVPEKLELKIDTFGELDRFCPEDCILGSNSSSFKSSLMLDKVHEERRRLVCNIHYTMPPQIRTVELMTDGETFPEVFGFLSEVLRGCGMLPATARKESTGFIFNRLWAAVKREIMMILAEGVSDAAEIDALWAHMFQAAVTPCRLMDKIGLDTVAFIEDNYISERNLDGKLTVDFLREKYTNQGRLGLKTADKGGLYPPPASSTTPSRSSSSSDLQSTQTKASSVSNFGEAEQTQALYFLDVGLGGNLKKIEDVSTNGKILRRDPATGQVSVLVSGQPAPDGIDVAPSLGKMFWTNMGRDVNKRDGSVLSANLDGSDVKTLIPEGGVHTPKQLVYVPGQEKIYFCDREGMGVHRIGVDGNDHEVLVQRSSKTRDLTQWCVGIAVDVLGGKIYWTQKGASKANEGRIFRCGIDIPEGETAENRSDIELVFGNLPEPIDLEYESQEGVLYWTDRGEHPRGSSLNSASVSGEEKKPRIIARHFHEPIGLKLDSAARKAFVTDLGGSVYRVDLVSGEKTVIHCDDGCYTGIASLRV